MDKAGTMTIRRPPWLMVKVMNTKCVKNNYSTTTLPMRLFTAIIGTGGTLYMLPGYHAGH